MKNCPKCKGELKDTAKFCKFCGANLKEYEEKAVKYCSECGAELDGGAFCSECGAPCEDTEIKENKKTEISIDTAFDSLDALLDGQIAENDREKGLMPFEYYEHSDGTYTVTGLKDKLALSLVIPKGVVAIGEGALRGSRAFTVSLPEGLLLIDKEAFKGCSELVKINCPTTLIKIGEEAFSDCEKLDLVLPKSIQIGENTFLNTAYTRRIEAETAAKLEEERLERERLEREKERLERERLENERRELQKQIELIDKVCECKANNDGKGFVIVKARTKQLDELIIPEGCTEICESAFEGSSLKKVVFPKSLSRIGRWAFYNCHYIEELAFPDGVFVGPSAFHRCESLVSVKFFGDGYISYYAFDNCRLLHILELGSCTSVGDSAFSGCVSLRYVEIPRSMSSLGNNAFRGCDLKAVTVPKLCKTYETTFPEGCKVIKK